MGSLLGDPTSWIIPHDNINPIHIASQMPWDPTGTSTLFPVVAGVTCGLVFNVWFSTN